MNIFDTEIRKKKFGWSVLSKNATAAVMVAAGAAMAVAPQAAAQSYVEDEYREWEPGEGMHEEEWYDPTDWFDDDFDGIRGPDSDNEYDWDDGKRVEWDEGARKYSAGWADYARSTLYTDGYYDGYTDGFEDDSYGYDVDVVGSDLTYRYKKGYVDGYYDGFYDDTQGYESDWTYYIYTAPLDRERERTQRERRDDEGRERGDRSKVAGTDRMSSRDAQRDVKKRGSRFRGEVVSVHPLLWENAPDELEGHAFIRTEFDDGRTMVIDLGENGNTNIFNVGDRITVHGVKTSVKGRKMIDAQRLSVNGEQLWNAGNVRKPEKKSASG